MIPLSCALIAAVASARSLTSVATTRSAKREAMSACTPQPVPRSSALCTGRRTMRFASVADAGPTAAT